MERAHKGIWVYAQHHGRKIDRSTLELLGKARKLADKVSVDLSAILLGFRAESLAQELIDFGADKVNVVEHEKLMNYTTMLYARQLADLILKEKPEVVLFSADTTGRDLAPRIAARLGTGLTADCVDLDIGDFEEREPSKRYRNILLQVVPAFGGNVMATIVNPERRPQMATVRPGTFEAPEADNNRRGDIVPFEAKIEEGDDAVEMLKVIDKEGGVNFEDAKIIVAGGRGVGGTKGFDLLRELAGTLNAEVGATRAAIDAGWISLDHMIGIGGQVVRPDIYIACGISGALHHTMGVRNSKTIIAINNDPKAPIFDIADYKVVGDLFEIIPKLIERIRSNHDDLETTLAQKS